MKFKTYTIISEVIENAIEIGYKRAHKHTDTPTSQRITDEIYNSVMADLGEIIDFEDQEIDNKIKST